MKSGFYVDVYFTFATSARKIRESQIFAQKEDLRARRFRKNDFGGTCVFSNEGFGSSNLGTRLFSCTEAFFTKIIVFCTYAYFYFS